MRLALAVPASLGLLGAATFAYSSLVERNAFRLREVQVPLLPPGTPDVRVLHLSDVHMMPGQQRKHDFIARLARLAPDVVFTTGDNLSSTLGVPRMLSALGPLLAFPGAFVLGSNDYFAPRPKNPLKYFFASHKRVHGVENPWRDLVAGMTAGGWCDLTNRRTTMRVGPVTIELGGVDDPHLKRDDLSIADPPVDPLALLHIALVHAPEPRALDRFEAAGFDLLLCGHTHGGQLRLPGFGAIVTNCGIDRARARGLSRHGRAWLHVSPGLGTSPYAPVRFACRPEATLLHLTARPSLTTTAQL
ncbi:MAG TPA: metallophosphoesterase [Mycobacteriales bacterium]|nr:metallophosphoesterase [Mycobacteriales bacterium]